MQLVIKAETVAQALKACHDNGFPEVTANDCEPLPKCKWVKVRITCGERIDLIQKWFHADDIDSRDSKGTFMGFKWGSLLHYCITKQEAAALIE